MKTLRKAFSGLLIVSLFVPHFGLLAQTIQTDSGSQVSSGSDITTKVSLSQIIPDSGISVAQDNNPIIEADSAIKEVPTDVLVKENTDNSQPQTENTPTLSQSTLPSGTRVPELTYQQKINTTVDTFSGALTQSIPVQIPSGRNGLQPNLSLDYNSQNQDTFSQIGFGWSLSIPSIERVNKTGIERLYSDNYFSSSLSGELATSSDITLFKAKNENGDFLKYSFVGNVWTVTDKKGLVYTFGATESNRQFSASSTASTTKWMLSEVRDTNNNFYRYEYLKDGNEIYPSKIFYTGNATQDGIYGVEFVLENRPDTYVSYKSGYKVETKKRIKEIVIKVSGIERGKYVLGYIAGANNTRSLLGSVTESRISESGSLTTMPATTFQYTNDPVTYVGRDDNYNRATRSGYFQSGRVAIDFDGNGLNEKVASYSMDYNNGVSTGSMNSQSLNLGQDQTQSFNKIVPSPWTTGPNGFPEEFLDGGTRIFDVNGDLLPDIVFSGGSVLASTTELLLNTNPHPRSSNIYLNTNNGDFSTSTYIQNSFPTFKYFNITGPYYYLATGAAQLANVNGDQIVDTYSVSTQCQSPNTIYEYGFCSKNGSYLGTGYGWKLPPARGFNSSEVISTNDNSPTVLFGDVNGDGLDDLIKESSASTTTAFINLGNNTWSAQVSNWSIPHPLQDPNVWPKYDQGVRTVDVNGDGLIDVIRSYVVNIPYNTSNMTYSFTGREMPFPTQGNIHVVYLNTGTQWVLSNLEPCSVVDGIEIIAFNWRGGFLINDSYFDANGDGLTDCGNNIRQGRKPDMLIKVAESAGATTDIEYKPTPQHVRPRVGNPGFYDQTHPKLPSVIYTVTKLTKSISGQPSQITEYVYEGGKNDFRGPNTLKFGGFKKVTETRGDAKIISYFHQGDDSDATLGEQNDEYAKIGKVFRKDVTNLNEKVFKRSWYKWDMVSRGNNAWYTYLTDIVDQTYDGNTTHKDRATTNLYDVLNGNLLSSTDWGEVQTGDTPSFTDVGNDKQVTTIAYATNTAENQFAPKEVSKVNATGTLIEKVKLYYDNLPHGVLTKGNNTKAEQYTDAATFVTTTKSYNAYGLIASSADANSNTTEYKYDTYNMYPIVVANALSQKTEYTYDYVFGTPLSVTTPDEASYSYLYDGFGRPVEEWVPEKGASSMRKTSFEYIDTPNNVSVKKYDYLDENNTIETYTYFDGLNRPIQIKHEGENGNWVTTDTIYDTKGRTSKQSLPYFTQTYSKSAVTINNNLFTSFMYDVVDRVLTQTNAVGVTRYEYDDWKKTVIDALSHSKYFYNDSFGNLVKVTESTGLTDYNTLYEYNGRNKLTKITDANNNIRNFTYDLLGRQLSAEDIHVLSDTNFATYTYHYDNSGNIIEKTTPVGVMVMYTYDAVNRILTEDASAKKQERIQYVYDTCEYGFGKVCEVKEVPMQPFSACDILGCASNLLPVTTKAMRYIGAGLVAEEVSMVSGETYTTQYTYDRQGNKLSIINPDASVTTNTYNEAGLPEGIQYHKDGEVKTIVSNIDYAPIGLPILQVHGNGTQTCNTYDQNKLYRLTNKKTVSIGGTCIGSTQAGQNEVTLIQALPTIEESFDQKIARLLQEGKAVVNEKGETRLAIPELIEETDKYKKMFIGYDSHQNKILALEISAAKLEIQQDPEVTGLNTVSGFNEQSQGAAIAGYAVTFTQARDYPHGVIEGFLATAGVQSGLYKISRYFLSFDTSILPDSAVPTIAKIKIYSRPYAMNSGYVGIVQGQQISGAILAYTDYSKCGNSMNNPTIGGQKNVSEIIYNQYNDFDLNQNGLLWLNPTGYSKFCIRVSADIENSFNSDTQNNIGASFYHEGDPSRKHSILIEYIIPGVSNINNLATTTLIQLPHPFASPNIYTSSYLYDSASNITSITNTIAISSPQVTTYSYDSLNRLLSANSSSTQESFTYDPLGNIFTKNGIPYLYETPNKTNPHAVTKVGAITLTYDENGNALTIGEASNPTYNTWNYKNELLSTTKGTQSLSYLYDYAGTRIQKTVHGLTTTYPTASFSQTSTGTTTSYIMLGNDNVATIESTQTTPRVLFNHTDHLGSTIATTNEAGNIVEQTTYSAFGHQTTRSSFQGTKQTEKYTGHTYDPESDMLYAGARYYRGSLGRFMSQDKISYSFDSDKELYKNYLANPQAHNTYSYVLNNPVKYTDPTGNCVGPLALVCGAIIAYGPEALAFLGFAAATNATIHGASTAGTVLGTYTSDAPQSYKDGVYTQVLDGLGASLTGMQVVGGLGSVGGSVKINPGQISQQKLLEGVTSKQLTKYIEMDYRTSGKIGNGGVADAIKRENITGLPVGGKFHTIKGNELINGYNKVINNQNNSTPDIQKATQLRDALIKVINN